MTLGEKLEKYASFLEEAESVCLLCHVNPDSDTIGSALALMAGLKKLGKTACVMCPSPVPRKLAFLPFADEVNAPTDIKSFDVCTAMDCSDPGRFERLSGHFRRAGRTLLIDHHKTTEHFADYAVSAPEAAAVGQLIYEVLRILERRSGKALLDRDSATLLYAAIVGDTGGFSFDNVTPETFAVASELLKFGIDARETTYMLNRYQPECRYRLKAAGMSGTVFHDDGRIGIITFRQEDFEESGASTEHTDGIIDELTDVGTVLVAFAISEVGKFRYKVSIRTKAPLDATAISDVFGGGGHERAAGCSVSGYYEDVVDRLLRAARNLIDA